MDESRIVEGIARLIAPVSGLPEGDCLVHEKYLDRFDSLTRSTRRDLIDRGEYPKPVKLGGSESRRVAWRSEDIRAWINSRPEVD